MIKELESLQFTNAETKTKFYKLADRIGDMQEAGISDEEQRIKMREIVKELKISSREIDEYIRLQMLYIRK